MLVPPVMPGIPYVKPTGPSPSGPLATTHTIVGPLPTSGGPTPTTMVHTILPFMHGVFGPSTALLAIPTIPVTTPIVRNQPYPTPFSHGNYILTGFRTIADPS